jgi:dihydrofolate reductase
LIEICSIAAVAENGVIGDGLHMPWKIRSELKYFERMTKHKPVIMGRKTFEALGQPLKERTNIIVTRDTSYTRPGIIVAHSLGQALDVAREVATKSGADEIMIGGGAEIYAQAMPFISRLYLTEIHLNPKGDIRFPAFGRTEWLETKREFHKAKEGETADYTITVLKRIAG